MDSSDQEFMPELREDDTDSFGIKSRTSETSDQVAAAAAVAPNMSELYPMRTSSMRVRDMINLYNLATTKNQELSPAKPVNLSANKLGKQMETVGLPKRHGDESGSDVASAEVFNSDSSPVLKSNHNEGIDCALKSSSDSSFIGLTNIDKCWESGAKLSESSISQQASKKCNCGSCNSALNQDKLKNSIKITTTDGQAEFKRKTGNADSTSVKEMIYQSRTTIRRTDGGVRIMIDIFFDDANGVDKISGNRVETCIPDSRILADFMQANEARGGTEKQ